MKLNKFFKKGIHANVCKRFCKKCNKETLQHIYEDNKGFYSRCGCGSIID
jgi:hypothetical protein